MMRLNFSLRSLFVVVAVCSVAIAAAPFFITGYHDTWTCALCRSHRTDYIYLGRLWRTEIRETSCSQWYAENIEPHHDHVWIHARATAIRDFYGNRYGAIDRDPAGRTLCKLSPEDQLCLYQHFSNPAEAKAVFLELASRESKSNKKDYELLNKLRAWKQSDFASPWQDASKP